MTSAVDDMSQYTSHDIMGLWHFVIHQLNFLNCTVFRTRLRHVILTYVTNILYNNHFLIYIKLCATIMLCCIPRDAIMLCNYNFLWQLLCVISRNVAASSNPKFFKSFSWNPSSVSWHYLYKMIHWLFHYDRLYWYTCMRILFWTGFPKQTHLVPVSLGK
jgi:hypothetical protein